MSDPIQIKMGGYGPPSTSFSRGLKLIGDRLEAQFGDRIDVKYVWNIMDLGYRGHEIIWLVESGVLTLGYQSTSYQSDRVAELGFADLPFVFQTTPQARAAMDGELGAVFNRAARSVRRTGSMIFVCRSGSKSGRFLLRPTVGQTC
jgi:TRAP-type C4-dicarboxylate transport system substrate-binding protein